ncbi:putative inorganic phosphate cotransporter [Lycorma delicatula]|uniref:putative inorganic phosphate cotransporter n=1 Tax=Lycorma delicatula TaxID=130591 RepID=UPI003F50DF57
MSRNKLNRISGSGAIIGFIQQRYVVTIFGFFLTALTSIAKYSITITLTEMVKDSFNYEFFNSSSNDVCPVDDYIEFSNSTKERKGEFDWSSESQGLIISAVFWLYAFLQTPFGFLIDRYGAKIIIVTSTLSSGLLMISLPFAARIIGVPGVIVVRVLIGVGQKAYKLLS